MRVETAPSSHRSFEYRVLRSFQAEPGWYSVSIGPDGREWRSIVHVFCEVVFGVMPDAREQESELLGLDEDMEPCHGELGGGLWRFVGHRFEPEGVPYPPHHEGARAL
jgi:hypothetical protein